MRAQSMGVALMDPSFVADSQAGVATSNGGAKAVDAVGDPVISQISQESNTADHAHDAAVNDGLWPAVKAGHAKAARAALKEADANVSKVFAGLQKIDARVETLRKAGEASASSAASTAQYAGIAA
jgi:hypothetical protein